MVMIDGRKIADEVLEGLKGQPRPSRFLAAVLVGEDSASLSFLNQKKRVAAQLGVDFRLYRFPGTISHDELRTEVLKIADHTTCGGVIVQLPLPSAIRRERVLDVIPPEKDVDVLGRRAYEAFVARKNPIVPPAVGTVRKILEVAGFEPRKACVAVVGADGFLVGRPVVAWFESRAKELRRLEIMDDLKALEEADLVVSGVGEPGLLVPGMLKNGASVIDFGYGTKDGKLMGDLDPAAAPSLSFWTPTPGGTGPVLVAELFQNFYALQHA